MIFIPILKNILLGKKTVGLQQLNAGLFISNKNRFNKLLETTLFFHPSNLAECAVLVSFKCTAPQNWFLKHPAEESPKPELLV